MKQRLPTTFAAAREALRAAHADLALHVAWMELRQVAARLERWYRPDQPRTPRGTPIGGQWIDDDRDHVAARRRLGPHCDGFSAGCRNGGSFGTSGIVNIDGRKLCWDCAIKFLGIQELSAEQQLKYIGGFDPAYRDESR